MQILPRDYLITPEGLAFAVVDFGIEDGQIACCFRYFQNQEGNWEKISTHDATIVLQRDYPQYLFHSKLRDTVIHAVPEEHILTHRAARDGITPLQCDSKPATIRGTARRAIDYLIDDGIDRGCLGVSGSLLLGAEKPDSDVDLVCYDESMFQTVRQLFQHAAGPFTPLTLDDWRETYRRRSCSLPFDNYLWHEQRKHNKAMIESTKIDISLVCPSESEDLRAWQKKGKIQLVTRVTDDSRAFHTPACWKVAHESVEEVITYSATYTGQALLGEKIEIAGLLEQSGSGEQRVIIGQSREADGAFIRVVPL